MVVKRLTRTAKARRQIGSILPVRCLGRDNFLAPLDWLD
jgi:hypothetical protein